MVLRAQDAIHLTTARIVAREARGETVEFWTHDDRQGNAARSVDLNVLVLTKTTDSRGADMTRPLVIALRKTPSALEAIPSTGLPP